VSTLYLFNTLKLCFLLFWWYYFSMINSDKNKRMMVVISKEEYLQLEKVAKENTRSVSKQALHFIRKGLSEQK